MIAFRRASRIDLRRVTLLLVFSLNVQPCSSLAGPADTASKETELTRLGERINHVRASLELARGEMDDVQRHKRVIERDIGRVLRSLKELSAELQKQQARLARLEQQRQQRKADLSVQRETFTKQMRAAYAMGRQERLKILLNQQDPYQLSRVWTYYAYFNHARGVQIKALEASLRDLRGVEDEVAETKTRLATLYQHRQVEKKALQTRRRERTAVIAALDADIHGKAQHLKVLRDDEAHKRQLLESLREALADIPAESGYGKPFEQSKGELPWPSQGQIVTPFGGPRKVAKLRWGGVVIAAKEGDEVRAISHGRVAFADWLRGFGLLTIIDHGDGYMSLYGYNQSLYKEIGDWVDAGELIASVGNTGGRREAGLYFEIRYDGRPIDPLRWCVRRRDNEGEG